MQYSVVIPTNRTDQTIAPLLWSLVQQSHKPYEVIIVADIAFESREKEEAYLEYVHTYGSWLPLQVITEQGHSDFVPQKGASYVRNYGINHARGEYILCIDDDNMLAPEMIKKLRRQYQELWLVQHSGLVIPTERYRDTNQIRSQGYSRFSYRLGRVRPEKPITDKLHKSIVFASSNCVFGPKRIFKAFPLREDIPFVYEDFEWTHRMTRAGYPLYALTHVYTQHLMRSKTPLQESYLHTPQSAYYKSKHRIMRVRSTATTPEKISYFGIGIHLHTAALIYKILRHAPMRQWLPLVWWVLRGTMAWFIS